ncbi:DNA integrity scanning protein DisA nucleotide-binding domain protein [Microbacterium sp. B2969]|uniref:DNA integrity scanning protein DisA nucleotide-binding domain protein n=1 Tax=Microbacterium alkaliflavum TaxID=3248839 RepID=A0ABW7QBA6_9MICO
MARFGPDGNWYIDQFMWGYQGIFRRNLAYRTDQAFKQIGLSLDPEAMLVGFAAPGRDGYPICVEPEDGPWQPEHFSQVLQAADDLFATDDDRRRIVTGDGQQAAFDSSSLDRVRRVALHSALMAAQIYPDRLYFVGGSQIVGGYRTFPILAVSAREWDAVPELPPYDQTSMRISNSLADELMYRVLQNASISLSVGSNPSELLSIARRPAGELAGIAASVFADGVATRVGGMPSELFEHLTAIAIAPYEGRRAVGRIAFVKPDASHSMTFHFGSPVPLSRTRSARKLLEMSGRQTVLLSDGAELFGVVESIGEDHFEATFDGRGSWTLSYAAVDYLTVSQGTGRLPAPPLDQELFSDVLARLFPEADTEPESLWELSLVAARQAHGTMLVIHRRADEEAARLAGQSVPIQPIRLDSAGLDAASTIDGAVLVAPDARCHALGVILDGVASDRGDPGRGARFNSASRYVGEHRRDCVIVVVSEDGSIEMVPPPRRRISRSLLAQLVSDVVAASSGDVDFERFHRLERKALDFAFYLSQSQCDALHSARETVERTRWSRSQIRMGAPTLSPHPDMDDSYFLDD